MFPSPLPQVLNHDAEGVSHLAQLAETGSRPWKVRGAFSACGLSHGWMASEHQHATRTSHACAG